MARQPSESEKARRAEAERKRRAAEETARIAEHNRRAERSAEARPKRPRILSKRVRFDPPPKPMNLAFRFPPAALYRTEGRITEMPAGAPTACPFCGASLPLFLGGRRYRCSTDRLAVKGYGCGMVWDAPESPIADHTAQ